MPAVKLKDHHSAPARVLALSGCRTKVHAIRHEMPYFKAEGCSRRVVDMSGLSLEITGCSLLASEREYEGKGGVNT